MRGTPFVGAQKGPRLDLKKISAAALRNAPLCRRGGKRKKKPGTASPKGSKGVFFVEKDPSIFLKRRGGHRKGVGRGRNAIRKTEGEKFPSIIEKRGGSRLRMRRREKWKGE